MENTIKTVKELRNRRRRLGISCKMVAERAGIGMLTVQRALSGGTGVRFDTILAIAENLGLSIEIRQCRKINTMREEQARKKAKRIVAMAQGTAGLECQGVSSEALKEAEDNIVHELLAGSNTRLWSE